jgi:isopentenyl diphosphate isomerase/L-lactate dehydrogenase-like FMN-dependent dehydrogenase
LRIAPFSVLDRVHDQIPFGKSGRTNFPITVAPTAAIAPLHPDGEIGMFEAATANSNTLMMVSTTTTTPHAKVAPAAPGGTLWGQFCPLEYLGATQRSMDDKTLIPAPCHCPDFR